MFPRSYLSGTVPVVNLKVLMSTPFLRPPPRTVESPVPHDVVSEESGSTTKSVETMVRSAAAAAVSVGGLGGADPAPGLPQLNRPPEPTISTAVGSPAQVPTVAGGGPELAQSWIPAVGGSVMSTLPSISSHPDGALSAVVAANAEHAIAMTRPAAA